MPIKEDKHNTVFSHSFRIRRHYTLVTRQSVSIIKVNHTHCDALQIF